MGLRNWWHERLKDDDWTEVEEPPIPPDSQETVIIPRPPRGSMDLEKVELYRASGESWARIVRRVPELMNHDARTQWPQIPETLTYLFMRSAAPEELLGEVRQRASVILLAKADASMYERLFGIRPLIPEELEA